MACETNAIQWKYGCLSSKHFKTNKLHKSFNFAKLEGQIIFQRDSVFFLSSEKNIQITKFSKEHNLITNLTEVAKIRGNSKLEGFGLPPPLTEMESLYNVILT